VATPRVWLGAYLMLMISVGINLALPLLDHHAAEYKPWHPHLVLGALSASERALALAFHRHGYQQSHAHDPLTGMPLPGPAGYPQAQDQPVVLLIADVPDGLISGGMGDSVFLVPIAQRQAVPPSSLWQPFPPVELFRVQVAAPPPTPPPRAV